MIRLGKVGYVHAGGIDAPLVLMDGRVPNYNWRGLPESSVTLTGASADCSIPTGSACTTILWPGNGGVYMKPVPYQGTSTGQPTWVGSLLANGVGSTGMAYRRNRFYDGATGQFNQQDPIGLAGGANSYGFAGGDPVSYSDPYGLMACPLFCFGGGGDFSGSGGGSDWGDASPTGAGGSGGGAPAGVDQSALVAALLQRGTPSPSSDGITDRNIKVGTGSATQYIRFGKAPDQVEPGIGNIKGLYTPEKRMQPERYSAHYDPFGRQIARTDYTAQPDPKTHTNPHHHIRTYGPGCGAKGCETGPLPGPYKLDQ